MNDSGIWRAPPRFVLAFPARVKWEKLTYERHFMQFGNGVISCTIPVLTVKEFEPDTKTISVRWCENVQICDH